MEVGFNPSLLLTRGFLATIGEEVAGGGGLGAFDFFIPGEEPFLPAGFVDDSDLIDRPEAFGEGDVQREQLDERKWIGGAVCLDEDDGIEIFGDCFQGIDQAGRGVATDAAAGNGTYVGRDLTEQYGVHFRIREIVENDVGRAWRADELRDDFSQESGFPGTEVAGNDDNGNAFRHGRDPERGA